MTMFTRAALAPPLDVYDIHKSILLLQHPSPSVGAHNVTPGLICGGHQLYSQTAAEI